MSIALLIVLVAVIVLGLWERERMSERHRDRENEMQARIDALTIAASSTPETRMVYSDLQGRQIPLRKGSSWYDSHPAITPTEPMRIVPDDERPIKKAGT